MVRESLQDKLLLLEQTAKCLTPTQACGARAPRRLPETKRCSQGALESYSAWNLFVVEASWFAQLSSLLLQSSSAAEEWWSSLRS